MSAFIFEIGTEEMPARFVPGLSDELRDYMKEALETAMVDFEDIESFATPRRVVVLVKGIAADQRSMEETVSGPPARIAFDADGNPTKAALGFAKGQGVAIEDVFTLETDKGEYIATKITVGGGKTRDILAGICTDILDRLTFPRRMRWGLGEFAFGRPIRWLLALLDEDVIPFEAYGVTAGRETYGHRVHGPGPFDVATALDWERVAKEQCKITVSPQGRMDVVRTEGDKLAAEKGGAIIWKDDLMLEVANLVEYPLPVLGRIEDKFLELPREVLLTSMQSHQKSFGVEKEDGSSLLPYFLTVLNTKPVDLDLVRKGWERVLKARLEDGMFFWKADTETEFETWLKSLDSVTFLAPLGSMGDKVKRLEELCGWLADKVEPSLAEDMRTAGRLSKCDLVSEMVQEFDKLQGQMGGIYAARAGYSKQVSEALYQQYLPAGPDTPVPASLSGGLLSIADKADTLAGCFGLNMIPTGAADPYALRRAVLGICRIVLEHGLKIDLNELYEKAVSLYNGVEWKLEPSESVDKLMEFTAQRLKAYFSGKGYETLVVEAAVDAGFSDVRTLGMRIEALSEFAHSSDFDQSVLTFKRAANIIRKQGSEAGVELTGGYDSDLFEDDFERALGERIEEVLPRFEERWEAHDFKALFALLGELRPAVDAFFDNVMVMCDDQAVKINRLNLLKALVAMLSRLADFNALQV